MEIYRKRAFSQIWFFQYFLDLSKPSVEKSFLIALIAIDALFIFLHIVTIGLLVVFNTPVFEAIQDAFSIMSDEAIPEHFNYAKWGLLIVFMGAIFYHTSAKYAVYLLFVFTVFLIDDAWRLHEQGGDVVAAVFEEMGLFGRYGETIGELSMFAVLGLIQFPLIWLAYRAALDRERPIIGSMVVAILILAAFGVFIDGIHSFLKRLFGSDSESMLVTLLTDQLPGIIEDGGEFFMISIVLVCGFRLLQAAHEE